MHAGFVTRIWRRVCEVRSSRAPYPSPRASLDGVNSMSWPALHAILNHFPIVLVVIGALALLIAVLRPRRGAWLYALASLTLAGISVYPAWQSGDEAADFVKQAWYIAPGAVNRHATSADITLWILLALGLASLIAWLSIARAPNAISPAGWLRSLLALLTIAALGSVAVTGYLGGKVVVESPILMNPVPPLAVPLDTTRGALPSGTTTAQPPATTAPQTTAPVTPPAATQPATQPATQAPAQAPATQTPATTAPATTTPAQPAPKP
jgi:uncharacterized membrane protein